MARDLTMNQRKQSDPVNSTEELPEMQVSHMRAVSG